MRILNEGTRLAGRYTLIRRLGAGGMAEIWLANDRQTDARVALKFLSGEHADDTRYGDLLQREWRIGSRLMHANIVRVFEFHDEPDGAYYSLQYVGDTSLAVLAGKDPAESMRPLGMIADALRYAHGKDVVHRDIKASNILLDSRGLPYLVDFGVASVPGGDALTGGGTDVASSPQQLAGEPATAADDIYALGVLMHELLTGLPPGVGADSSKVPGTLQPLLQDMLSDDAAKRPGAEQVAERLKEAGYPPGPAPARYVAGADARDEVFEAVESVQPARRAAPRPIQPDQLEESRGIPPKVLYGGLGGALAILLAVVFVLPAVVNRTNDAADTAVIPAEETALSDESAAAGTQEQPDSSGADDSAPAPPGTDGRAASFSENISDTGANAAARIRAATDEALGDLLSQLERLRYRAIDRWGGQDYLDAVDAYAEGDRASIARNYRLAGEKYRQASRMLEPFFDRIDEVFEETLAAAKDAFANGDHSEAVRLYDLAVAITPGNREAEAGLARAQNLEEVLALTEQGIRFEDDLELDAAKTAFERAIALDAAWEPAIAGLERVRLAIRQFSFEQRMTEGFDALAAAEFATARAAFNAAKALDQTSRQPIDGLLQVDQEVKLFNIRRLEREVNSLVQAEQWETSIPVYEEILGIDSDLQFAKEGLSAARTRAALHSRLEGYIRDPDTLGDDVNMQNATRLLLDVTKMSPMGPRLEDQKNELSRLLKRAATPVRIQFVSDGLTDVAIYRVGKLGAFSTQQLDLRPGVYVAVGSRPGYRDVRIEFRVAPEDEMQPIAVRCEEQI